MGIGRSRIKDIGSSGILISGFLVNFNSIDDSIFLEGLELTGGCCNSSLCQKPSSSHCKSGTQANECPTCCADNSYDSFFTLIQHTGVNTKKQQIQVLATGCFIA